MILSAPTLGELRPALAAHCDECVDAFAQLRHAVLDASQPHRRPLRALEYSASDVPTATPTEQRGHMASGQSLVAEEHYAAVRDLTVAHLVELLVLRLFGPARIREELAQLAGLDAVR